MKIYLKQWWTQTCLVGTETAQKANIDPEARKKKDVAKLLGAMQTIRKADEMWARGWQLWRKLWEDILIWRVWLKL